MKQRKNAFTLIELLAVIVILAIVALIATPIILGIIKDAKDNANKRSVENYIDAVEQAIVRKNMTEIFRPTECDIADGKVTCDGKELKVEVDGEAPINGTIKVDNGSVVKMVVKEDNKYIIYEDGKIVYNGEIATPKSFKEDSWKTIALNVKIENIGVYEANLRENTNNTKEVSLQPGFTNQESNSNGLYTVRIVNITSDDPVCKNDNYSKTACGFVVEFEDIITTHEMNPDGEYKDIQYDYGWNVDGYPASSMYTYIKNDIYDSLPEDLKGVIIDTKVISSHGSTSEEPNFISTDKLYLLSTKEVWGSITGSYDTSTDKTRQLDYYFRKEVATVFPNFEGAIKKYNGIEFYWWLRSAYSSDTNTFFCVVDNGDFCTYNAFDTNGVSPAFRIG